MHFGAPWPISFAGIVRSKFGNDPMKRKMALEGHRFTPQEALEVGIVDYVVNGNTAAVLARAEQLGDQWSGNAQGGVWGSIKVESNLSYSITFDANHKHDSPNFIVMSWKQSTRMQGLAILCMRMPLLRRDCDWRYFNAALPGPSSACVLRITQTALTFVWWGC